MAENPNLSRLNLTSFSIAHKNIDRSKKGKYSYIGIKNYLINECQENPETARIIQELLMYDIQNLLVNHNFIKLLDESKKYYIKGHNRYPDDYTENKQRETHIFFTERYDVPGALNIYEFDIYLFPMFLSTQDIPRLRKSSVEITFCNRIDYYNKKEIYRRNFQYSSFTVD